MIIATYPGEKRNLLTACKVFKVLLFIRKVSLALVLFAGIKFPPQPVHSAPKVTPSTYLYCSGSSRGAGSDLEQPRFCWCCLASFPRGSTLVNNQGLPTKHAHQMRRLFSLHYSFLEKRKLAISFKLLLLLKRSTRRIRNGLYNLEYSHSTQLVTGAKHKHRSVFKLSSHNCHFIVLVRDPLAQG